MTESRWTQGQLVEWSKVNPYKAELLVGEAGNIHISGKGRYHVYWHRELPGGQIDLVHHGGADGFADLKSVKHQHERVILRYTGMSINIPPGQQYEISDEEKQEGIPILRDDFPTLASNLEQLRIPGEQQKIKDWVGVLQDVAQDLPVVTSHGRLTEIRERLQKLLDEKSFTNSTNRYKQEATRSLRGIDTRGQMLLGVNEAQGHLLRRAQQTVEITLGTMKRYNDLERLQTFWNGIIDSLPAKAAHVIRVLQNPAFEADDRIERAVNINILHPDLGLEAQLRQLKGEPYFSGAQQFIEALTPVKSHWEDKNREDMLSVLTKQVQEMEIWRRSTKEENTGVGFGRYQLS